MALTRAALARAALARAALACRPLVLLDDTLSPVDAQVGRHIFASAVLGRLRGEGRTAVMASRQLQCLPHCDHVAGLADGGVAQAGS